VVVVKRSLLTVLGVAVLALLALTLTTPAAALGDDPALSNLTGEGFAAWSFTDVTETTWCHDAVKYVYDKGLMKGVDQTTFAPAATLTRAMLVTVIYRLAGQPEPTAVNPFADVVDSTYYDRAAMWAAEKGLLSWTTGSTFGPNDPATREQFVVALYRYAVLKGYDVSVGEDTNILSYNDAFDITEGMASAFQWACGAGVVEGNGPWLHPLDGASRGQTATMLMRFLEKVVK
jgi:hypothetical protein